MDHHDHRLAQRETHVADMARDYLVHSPVADQQASSALLLPLCTGVERLMSQGKYSPFLDCSKIKEAGSFIYNAQREIAPNYTIGDPYDEKVHFGDYDAEGFDRYGYSAWDADGEYVGAGNGVDRGGYTEMEYLSMSNDKFKWIAYD